MSISFRTASIAACLAGASALAAAPLSNTNVDSYDVRAGTETFAALSDEPIAKNTRVVVVECLSGRTVSVTPC